MSMTAPDQDKLMAEIARSLAQALCGFARERDDVHKNAIAQLHTDLCAAWRAELDEAAARDIAQQLDPQAGGSFRQCLVDAALKGMEFERNGKLPIPEPQR